MATLTDTHASTAVISSSSTLVGITASMASVLSTASQSSATRTTQTAQTSAEPVSSTAVSARVALAATAHTIGVSSASTVSTLQAIAEMASQITVKSTARSVYVIRPTGVAAEDDNYPTGYALNMHSQALSRVSAPIYGVSGEYVSTDTGVAQLGGDDTTGTAINAWVNYGERSFGNTKYKRMDTVYATATCTDRLLLEVGAAGKSATYMARSSGDVMRPHRVDVGKGLQGVYFSLVLKNQNGADFTVDGVEARVATTAGRA